jgi:hypothetical protein
MDMGLGGSLATPNREVPNEKEVEDGTEVVDGAEATDDTAVMDDMEAIALRRKKLSGSHGKTQPYRGLATTATAANTMNPNQPRNSSLMPNSEGELALLRRQLSNGGAQPTRPRFPPAPQLMEVEIDAGFTTPDSAAVNDGDANPPSAPLPVSDPEDQLTATVQQRKPLRLSRGKAPPTRSRSQPARAVKTLRSQSAAAKARSQPARAKTQPAARGSRNRSKRSPNSDVVVQLKNKLEAATDKIGNRLADLMVSTSLSGVLWNLLLRFPGRYRNIRTWDTATDLGPVGAVHPEVAIWGGLYRGIQLSGECGWLFGPSSWTFCRIRS